MSLGGPVFKQHIVEFVYGVGVVVDGVIDMSYSVAGPWDWSPAQGGPRLVLMSAIGAGAGGSGGGGASGVCGVGGGGSGGAGTPVIDIPQWIRPGEVWTITLGAPGAGGAPGAPGTTATAGSGSGGNTTIAGLVRPTGNFGLGIVTLNGGSGQYGGKYATGAGFAGGGTGGYSGPQGAQGGAGGNAAGSDGAKGSFFTIGTAFMSFSAPIWSASGGGASAAYPFTSAGGSGADCQAPYTSFLTTVALATTGAAGGAGNQSILNGSQTSFGGGAAGPYTMYGRGGPGGNGNAAGGDATGYGSGGGGGNAAGGKGAPGYVRLVYEAAD